MKNKMKLLGVVCLLFVCTTSLLAQKKFFKAIDKNKMKVLEKALVKGESINDQRSSDGLTPLLYAIESGKEIFVLRILKEDPDLELRDQHGNTALMKAIKLNRMSFAKILLEKGASMMIENSMGHSPISYLAKQNNETNTEMLNLQKEILLQLLKEGADLNSDKHNPLLIAVKSGNMEMMKLMLENGASLAYKSSNGFTPYLQALKGGNIKVIDFILQNDLNANVNMEFEGEITPLIVTIGNNRVEAAKYLIDKGADLEYRNSEGFSPLKAAVVYSCLPALYYIIEKSDFLLDLNDSLDKDIMASSIVYSDNQAIFAMLTYREKNYYNGRLAENKSYDASAKRHYAEAHQYMLQAIEHYKESRKIFDNTAFHYSVELWLRGNVLARLGPISLFIPDAKLDAHRFEAYLYDRDAVHNIRERYNLQLRLLDNKLNTLSPLRDDLRRKAKKYN